MRAATYTDGKFYRDGEISIHAAHAGCDICFPPSLVGIDTFQSTQPMRAATKYSGRCNLASGISIHAAHAGCDEGAGTRAYERNKISIHAAHAGCDRFSAVLPKATQISIHAAHAGCDQTELNLLTGRTAFQSTQPMRAATLMQWLHFRLHSYFNPRSPCGLRR